MQRLSSKERILRTLAGQPTDRIPIFAPIPWHPLSPDPTPEEWKAQPNYRQLISLAAEFCDFYVTLDIPERNPLEVRGESARIHGIPTGVFDRRFFLTPAERVEVFERGKRDGCEYTAYRVHTPKGDLTTLDAVIPGVDTLWSLEPLIKDVDDAEKILSVPYRFDPPDLIDYITNLERLGERGVAVCFVSSPLVMVSRMMDFQTFLEWTVTERALLERMLQTIQERLAERLAYVLEKGVGPIIRFGGCEQATPPMMSRRFFDELVVKYEAPLWRMVREAGRVLWVHCHGKVSTVLERFLELGVQMLDPVEPPPQGDIHLAEAKRQAARGPMTLVGNIEMSDLQMSSEEEVEQKVSEAICRGGREHFILGVSDVTISAVNDRLRDNITRFVEAGIRYGTFGNDSPCCNEL
jgi:uroporphyrinogen-III decarboxylase